LIKEANSPRERETQVLLLSWIVFPFSIFLFGREKLEWYLVSIYPALALLVGNYLFLKRDSKKIFKVFPRLTVIFLVILAFLSIYPLRVYDFDPYNKSLALKMKEISSPEDKITFYNSRSISFIFYSDRFAAPSLKREEELVRRLNLPEKGFFCVPEKDFEKIKERIRDPSLTFLYPEAKTSPFTRKVDKRVLIVKK
jgi:hypothetical protein